MVCVVSGTSSPWRSLQAPRAVRRGMRTALAPPEATVALAKILITPNLTPHVARRLGLGFRVLAPRCKLSVQKRVAVDKMWLLGLHVAHPRAPECVAVAMLWFSASKL